MSLAVGSHLALPDGCAPAAAPAAPRHLTATTLFPQSDLLDVNQIIKDLASMVSEQGEAIGECPRHPPNPRLPSACPSPQGGTSCVPGEEAQGRLRRSEHLPPPSRASPGSPAPRKARAGGVLPTVLSNKSWPPCPLPWALLPGQGLRRVRTGSPGCGRAMAATGPPVESPGRVGPGPRGPVLSFGQFSGNGCVVGTGLCWEGADVLHMRASARPARPVHPHWAAAWFSCNCP